MPNSYSFENSDGTFLNRRDRVLSATLATLAVSGTLHDGKTVLLSRTAGVAATLPAARGTGAKFRFVVGVVPSSGNHVIKVANATDVMFGNIITNSTAETPDLNQPWPTAVDSDTITLNGTTTGARAIGDFIEVEDIAAGKWAVCGVTTTSSTEATPFSASV